MGSCLLYAFCIQSHSSVINSFAFAPQRKVRTPWLSVCTSVPVWVLWVSLGCQAGAFFTFLTNIPNYLNGVLHFSLEEVPVLRFESWSAAMLESTRFVWQ